jgi:Na+-transporting NADH:ubiquinone oxidoreductase subunit NqrB
LIAKLAKFPPIDGRYYQIAALGALLALNMAWLDFAATPINSLAAMSGCLAAQAIAAKIWRTGVFDPKSALITGLSLSLLLRADTPFLLLAAGFVAIASKFVLRLNGKHIWNPACLAIVALRFGADHAWISPGQWGSAAWFAVLLLFLATLVLQRNRRADTALFFLGSHLALLCARAHWLGDPIAIPIHQMESGSLLLFTFFMVTDPRTTPDSRLARFGFALLVALLAHYIAFFLQMREALYLALFIAAPISPLLDWAMPARRFAWNEASQALERGT